uniref:TTF-type domain-containing protein n=1 Tax=Kalanchoe fedtschenkoi TaxID=63787 RepID=A0A7N0TDF6_KALFE
MYKYYKRKTSEPSASTNFNENWFTKYKDWLEYSLEKDAVFCLCCYLFRLDIGKQGSGESFVGKGFTSWNKQDRLDMHVGGPASAHNLALQKCKDLMKREQHIDVVMHKRSDKAICEYRTRLLASIDCVRFLLCQGLSFRGHDESESSSNKGNFLELLKFLADHNESIDNVVLQNAPRNLKLIAPNIQKDISNAAAHEVVTTIIKDIDGDYFAILIDESRDVSVKEHMVIIERLIGIVHVSDTTTLSLKRALDSLFTKYNLTISRVRGQGYDGASNMRGEFKGLKTLIMKENSSAFYVHCFAHQLLLTLVAIAKNHDEVASLFYLIGILTGVVGASCKRQDMLREEQAKTIRKTMEDGELVTGREKLHIMRNNEWDSLLEEVFSLCKQHDILPIDMSDRFVQRGRSRRKAHSITNLHHYRVEWYYSIIDMQILELNNRFDETNTELLRCMSRLSPSDRFAHFDKDKILRFATFYPSDFSEVELKALDRQLDTTLLICDAKMDIVYKWVYLLVKLSLILPVATSTVERAFSAINIIKNRLRNSIGDQWMNDCLITFIEKEIFKSISNNVIYERFQNMKTRRVPI